MISKDLWKSKSKKSPVMHQQRPRRARSGELVQIDGSPHAWFEERGEKCTLIVFIDDATGQTYGKFFPTETTEAYLEVTYDYIKKYGRPKAMYSDRHSIFKINKPGTLRKENTTQFGRALRELDIQLHWANSPQAKGRVERANKTLQDRLVKELRLQGIQDIETANKFLQEKYWEDHNRKFQKEASDKKNEHRQSPSNNELRLILSEKHIRKVSKNLEFQFENTIYQIKEAPRGLVRSKITIIKQSDGELQVTYKGRKLHIEKYEEQVPGGIDSDSKRIAFTEIYNPKIYKPSKYHPWNQEGQALIQDRKST